MGGKRPPLQNIVLGGGFVESFAFGGEAPPEQQSGGKTVGLQAPITPFSLGHAIGISSAAFAATCSQVSAFGFSAGAKLDPQANIWPITSARFPEPQQAI